MDNPLYTLFSFANRNYSLIVLSALSGLYSSLHHCGMQLDTLYKDQLDKLMVRFLAAKTQLYKSYCLCVVGQVKIHSSLQAC